MRSPPRSPLFPYTTLFRSQLRRDPAVLGIETLRRFVEEEHLRVAYERPGEGQHLKMLLLDEPSESLRSEEHTSELQSRPHLVCRLLLEKKKQTRCRRSPSR